MKSLHLTAIWSVILLVTIIILANNFEITGTEEMFFLGFGYFFLCFVPLMVLFFKTNLELTDYLKKTDPEEWDNTKGKSIFSYPKVNNGFELLAFCFDGNDADEKELKELKRNYLYGQLYFFMAFFEMFIVMCIGI